MQNCYVPGTRNVTSQLLKNYYIRDLFMHNCMERCPLHIAPVGSESRRQEDNSIVTAFDPETASTVFFRVHSFEEDSLTVTRLVTERFDTSGVYDLPWDKVGLQRYIGESQEHLTLPAHSINGKGVLVQNVLTEYKSQWLQSKKAC
jgi:hypothetical protein